MGGHEEREQTLNQLLVELDGFDPTVGVVHGRLAILKVHAMKIRLAPGIELDRVAGITVGFAGADLANVVNEAALVVHKVSIVPHGVGALGYTLQRPSQGQQRNEARRVAVQRQPEQAFDELGNLPGFLRDTGRFKQPGG